MIGIGVSEIMVIFYLIILVGVWILILFWVYRDAVRRYPHGSMKPVLWFVTVFFLHLLGLVLYILLRPEKIEER